MNSVPGAATATPGHSIFQCLSSQLYFILQTEGPFCPLVSLGCKCLQQSPEKTSNSSFHAGDVPRTGSVLSPAPDKDVLLSPSVPSDKPIASVQMCTENQQMREKFCYFHFFFLLSYERNMQEICLKSQGSIAPSLTGFVFLLYRNLRSYDFYVPSLAVRAQALTEGFSTIVHYN